MTKQWKGISLSTAALISGLTLFIPTAPYAEFYVFKKLITSNNAIQVTQNLLDNQELFLSGIFAILLTFIKDVVLAWTMYIFLRPVNSSLAQLAWSFRLIYVCLAVVSLFNLVYAFQLVNAPGFQIDLKSEQVLQLVQTRTYGMHLAYIFFGIYLILIGALAYKASYIPKVLGILLILAGLSWIMHGVQPYFFKKYDFSWMMFFSIGELAWAIWLLVKGSRIKESEILV
jgi:hypothetical protein